MPTRIARAWAAAFGLSLLLGSQSAQAAAPDAANGLFFIHGTGNYSAPTSAAGAFQASGGTAISSYWTATSLGKMATYPVDTSYQWSYGVAGYCGDTCAALNSACSCYSGANNTVPKYVADQLYTYYWSGNGGQIYNVVLLTHSNGSNVARYWMAHGSETFYSNARAMDISYSSLLSVVQKTVFLAPDSTGTPLADKITQSGSLSNLANDVIGAFSVSNSGAVAQQVQSNMATYNSNGTYANGTSPGGLATDVVRGTKVYAAIWSSDAYCGSYAITAGLKACALYGWGSIWADTDGFIGTDSSGAVGNVISSDARLNHNQSRRSCHNANVTIRNSVHGAMNNTFDAIPSDYAVSPAEQACNASWQGWLSASKWSPGCTAAMQGDTATDFDCQAAYGGDNGYNLSAYDNPSTVSAYFAASNYHNGGVRSCSTDADCTGGQSCVSGTCMGCSDSWQGDGYCDFCLLARYGHDSAPGSTANDDCVNLGAGTQNHCSDLEWYDTTASYSFSNGYWGYYNYLANH